MCELNKDRVEISLLIYSLRTSAADYILPYTDS